MLTRNRRIHSFFCERCGFSRNFSKHCIDHREHFAATLLTCGLWVFLWAFLARCDAKRAWRCCICKSRKMPAEEAAEPNADAQPEAFEIKPRRAH